MKKVPDDRIEALKQIHGLGLDGSPADEELISVLTELQEHRQMAEDRQLPPEIVSALRDNVVSLTREEAAYVEEMLGVELVVRDLPDGTLGLSRLSLANSFINDAKPGLRLAMVVDEKDVTQMSDIIFMDTWEHYSDEQKEYAAKMHHIPVLAGVLKLRRGK